MTNKHTKGTWTIEKENKSLIIFSGKTYICSVSSSDVQKEEHEANAKLIAAAPELLKALQMLLKSHFDLSFKETKSLFNSPIEQIAQAAIDKATK